MYLCKEWHTHQFRQHAIHMRMQTHTHTHLASLSLQHISQPTPDPEPSGGGATGSGRSHLLPLSPPAPTSEWSCEELLHLSDSGGVVDNVQRLGVNTKPGVANE